MAFPPSLRWGSGNLPQGKLSFLEARRSVILHSDIFLFILIEKIDDDLMYLKEFNHN